LNLIQANGPIVDNRFSSPYQITSAGLIEMGGIVIGALQPYERPAGVTPAPTPSPGRYNGNGCHDKPGQCDRNVTDSGTFRAGYREPVMDDYGTGSGCHNLQALALEPDDPRLDGKMLYDQLLCWLWAFSSWRSRSSLAT
jgi:hypothetical protein